MIENYLIEINDALISGGMTDNAAILASYREKYDTIIACGKSPFEAVLALGDPVEAASQYTGVVYTAEDSLAKSMLGLSDCPLVPADEPTIILQINEISPISVEANVDIEFQDESDVTLVARPAKKLPTLAGIIATDILYIMPGLIISVSGLISLAFLGGLVGFIGISYMVICWTVFSDAATQISAFILSIIGILLFIGATLLTVLSIRKIVKGLAQYSSERKASITEIKAAKLQ